MDTWLPSPEGMRSAINVIVVLLGYLGGIAVSAASGLFWNRYRILHLAPFVYGFLFGLSLTGNFAPQDAAVAAFYGLFFYAISWFTIWRDRDDERRRRAEEGARRAWRFDVALSEIRGEVEDASAGRYTRVRVEPNNRLDEIIVAVDLRGGHSQADKADIAAQIRSIIEADLPAEDRPAWTIFLMRKSLVVYSLKSSAGPQPLSSPTETKQP